MDSDTQKYYLSSGETPATRIQKYLVERAKCRGLDQEVVHELNVGSARHAALLIADLVNVCAEVDALRDAAERMHQNAGPVMEDSLLRISNTRRALYRQAAVDAGLTEAALSGGEEKP